MSWYIDNGHCYKCMDSGVVPCLQYTALSNGKRYFESLAECDCIKARAFYGWFENAKTEKKERHYIGQRYNDIFGETFQFPWSEDFMTARQRPFLLGYHEVFYLYSHMFWKNKIVDKNPQILVAHLGLTANIDWMKDIKNKRRL